MLNMLTTTIDRQAAFELAVTKLFEQGKRATPADKPDTCAYRTPSDDRCAIGWLIDEEVLYMLANSAANTSRFATMWRQWFPKLDPQDALFLARMQTVLHDQIDRTLTLPFKDLLLSRARDFGASEMLDTTFLEKFNA